MAGEGFLGEEGKVEENPKDLYVVKLIQAHAEVVSKFVESGYEEVRKSRAIPIRDAPNK